MSNLSLRVDDSVIKELDQLAIATGRSKSYLVKEALKEYLPHEAWQVSEIKKSLIEANNRKFATDQQVSDVFNKWNPK